MAVGCGTGRMSAIAHRSCDPPGREAGTRNKSQQRSEAGDGGGADEMQTGDARFKSRGQNRKIAVRDDAAAQLRIENVDFIDVNSVTGCQQDMIDAAGATVQCQGDTIAVASRLETTDSFNAAGCPASAAAATGSRWAPGSAH